MKKIILFLLVLNALQSAWAQSNPMYVKLIQQHRKTYLSAFKNNPNSPLSKKGVKQVQFFGPDERYYVHCQFTLTPDAQAFDLPTYSGVTQPYVQYGIAKFQLEGKSYQLSIYRKANNVLPQYRDYLFVPFKDLSNGDSTYGGGRYLDLRLKDIVDSELMLDFNKAYNPYCAYSDGYACPIPPSENHLDISILVGEKQFLGTKQ